MVLDLCRKLRLKEITPVPDLVNMDRPRPKSKSSAEKYGAGILKKKQV
jgi:hypothetical protein